MMDAPNDTPPTELPPPGPAVELAAVALAAGLPLFMLRQHPAAGFVAWVLLIGLHLIIRRARGPRGVLEGAIVIAVISFFVATTLVGIFDIRTRKNGTPAPATATDAGDGVKRP